MKFSQLVQHLGLNPTGTSLADQTRLDPELTGVAGIDQATSGQLSFVDSDRLKSCVGQTQASALILRPNEELQAEATDRKIAWMATEHPRLLFAEAITLFYQPWQPPPGIDSTAVIHPSVTLAEDIVIGAHVAIQANVVLGHGVCIHPNVVVYPQVRIGDRTVLHANCVIHERTEIGADCVIHSGAVIGAAGFGFVPTEQGWQPMPQSGRTVLGDQVEVGCNSTIDRPAVGETRIGQGSKIDNLVHIGHGCQLGPDCLLAGQVGLAGRVMLGERVILAGQVGVADQVQIGNGVIATAKTGIIQDVAANTIVAGGPPALPKQQWLRTSVLTRRLPELARSLKRIQRQMERLTSADP